MAELVKQQSQGETATVERTQSGPTFVPRFDILENDEELTLFGDLPGVRSEDLDIRFENNQLIVHGRVAPRHENREFVYGEYGVGDFFRVFNIGESVDSGKISAELSNGTLTLHLPKTEAVKPRKIAVKSG